MSELQRVLQRLIADSGKSLSEISRLSGVDRSYIMRLVDGEKDNPSPETLARIWMGVCMDSRVVGNHPEFVHGLAELLLAVGLTRLASSQRTEWWMAAS